MRRKPVYYVSQGSNPNIGEPNKELPKNININITFGNILHSQIGPI